MPGQDMRIISAAFTRSGIRKGFGKIFAILGRPSSKQHQFAIGKNQRFVTGPAVACAYSLGFSLMSPLPGDPGLEFIITGPPGKNLLARGWYIHNPRKDILREFFAILPHSSVTWPQTGNFFGIEPGKEGPKTFFCLR
jgi:hypothetical protein